MKHAKKLLALALSAALLAGCAAQGTGSTGNATAVRTETLAAQGKTGLSDVSNGTWFADVVNWSLEQELIDPAGADSFSPDADTSRATLAAALYRSSAGSPEAEAGQDFADETSISAYAAQAVDWSRANGVVSGYDDGRFNPQGHVTRAQIAVIL